MIQGKKILGIIPARGGSKGILGKNIRVIAGKPLIAWTIEEAKKSKYLDRLILSSDDAAIIKVAKKWDLEVPFVRPSDLARDNTPGVDPVLHALKELPGYDYVVLLQPTSPLRSSSDIDGCIEACISKNAPVCVSVVKSEKSPYWSFELKGGRLAPLFEPEISSRRRQDLPSSFSLNGAGYVAKTGWFLEAKTFICPETTAFEMSREGSLDIDTELDIRICEIILSEIKNELFDE